MFRYTHLMASRDSSAKVQWQIKRAVAETMAAQYIYSAEKIEKEYLWTVFGYFLMDHGMDMLKIFYSDIVASAMDDDMPQAVESFQDDMYHKQREEMEVKKNKQYNDSRKWNKIDDRKRAAAVLAKWWMESESKEKLRKMSTNTDPSFWQVAWVRDGDQLHMKFHQDFYYDLENTGQSRQYFESGWPLNLKIYRRNQPEVNFFMQNFSREMTFNNFSDQDWIFINGMDLFRTEYSEEMLQQLIKGVRDQTLPPMCRMKLQNDLFALTRDCRMSLQLLIKCLLDYSHETDFCIWYDMVKNFDSLHQLLQNKQRDEIWAKFAIPFFHNIWMVVGWEKKQDEQPIITMLRGELIAIMGRIGDQEIVSEARRRFKYFMNHREYLDPNIRYGVSLLHLTLIFSLVIYIYGIQRLLSFATTHLELLLIIDSVM
ncbi:NPEPPS [Acanthosepion pharaonis]|uniref:NPEPPS n=1 Tax=Acanthosepion pharaonis TaxID=158019 RepID=A0A812E752_ACAPH|nr:NPEPPS [Sepia pharaonis]